MTRYWLCALLSLWATTVIGHAQAGLAYDFTIGSTTRSAFPSDTLALPQTNVGDKSSAVMSVRNGGNGEVLIGIVATSTSAFPLDSTPFLPITLRIGESISFNINFIPTQPGTATARLQIGNASFNLSGVGIGATLTYAAVIGSASTTLGPNAAVIFTPTQVGSTSSVQVQIGNTGNTVAFINSISANSSSIGVFTLTSVPGLPLRVD